MLPWIHGKGLADVSALCYLSTFRLSLSTSIPTYLGVVLSDLKSDIKKQVRNPGGLCGVKKIYSLLNDEEKKTLEEAFADPDIPSAAIARALTERGHKLSAFTARHHQRGECSCD